MTVNWQINKKEMIKKVVVIDVQILVIFQIEEVWVVNDLINVEDVNIAIDEKLDVS